MSRRQLLITSLGMFDVDFFTPIVNPPNVAILGVGRIHDATAWEGDRPFRRREMTLSLTIDHRAVDGAPAAVFLRPSATCCRRPTGCWCRGVGTSPRPPLHHQMMERAIVGCQSRARWMWGMVA